MADSHLGWRLTSLVLFAKKQGNQRGSVDGFNERYSLILVARVISEDNCIETAVT